MNTNLCYQLSIADTPFAKSFDPYSMSKGRHTKLDYQLVFSDTIKDLFQSLNLEIILVEVFYSKPFLDARVHTDCSGGDFTKINWIFGGENSSMHWYRPKVEKLSTNKTLKTLINTDFISYESYEVERIHSAQLIKPTLVQVGVPHSVTNNYNHRWCVSVVYINKLTGRRPTMEDSINIFKDFLIA
jgi:hypothetical protein